MRFTSTPAGVAGLQDMGIETDVHARACTPSCEILIESTGWLATAVILKSHANHMSERVWKGVEPPLS